MSESNHIFIIAEAGVNHNGSLDIAKIMIEAARDAGADAVKFQTFNSDSVISKFAPKAEYQKAATGNDDPQLDMVRRLELSYDDHVELINHCKKVDIKFLSTPFDHSSIDLLVQLGLDIFKIPSGEITNYPYLKIIGRLKKKIIISTGMANLGEIESALHLLISCGTEKRDITVLHCNTEYPTPYKDVNLKAMLTIKKAFDIEVGYSDHTLGIEVPIAAAALGARIIEKHFTLDRKMEGPDHKASLEPDELKMMVNCIRNIEMAMGDDVKKASPSEKKNMAIARKSIVALKAIKKGTVFTPENITCKRPATGISPVRFDEILGREAIKDFLADELIII